MCCKAICKVLGCKLPFNMEWPVVDEYPYTGEDIRRVTKGYLKPGLLRMWISDGRLTPGPRAKSIQGGPRMFNKITVFKAGLMAELRKHGVSLPACQDWAEHFIENLKIFGGGGTAEDALRVPFFYVIKPDSGTVVPITASDWEKPLNEIMFKYGPSVLIIDILGFLKFVSAALDDEVEEADADASQDGETA